MRSYHNLRRLRVASLGRRSWWGSSHLIEESLPEFMHDAERRNAEAARLRAVPRKTRGWCSSLGLRRDSVEALLEAQLRSFHQELLEQVLGDVKTDVLVRIAIGILVETYQFELDLLVQP